MLKNGEKYDKKVMTLGIQKIGASS